MGNKRIKTHFDRKVLLTFLLLFGLGVVVLSFKMNTKTDCTAVDFDIIADSYTTDELIEFKSIDNGGSEWRWDFGDRSEKGYTSNVVHQFEDEGLYKVKLMMNDFCEVTKEVRITKRREVVDPSLIPIIGLPENVRVGDKVTFRNDSPFAQSWEWSFGETSIVDSKEQSPDYEFGSPGEKIITLIVNGNTQHASRRKLLVLPKKETKRKIVPVKVDHVETVLQSQIPDAPPPTEVKPDPVPVAKKETKPEVKKIVVTEESLKQLLVGYANRRVTDTKLRQLFCYGNIPVFNKAGNRHKVSQLLSEIRDKKVDINSIRIVQDNKTGCMQSFTINMKIKKGLFWKDF